MTVWLKFAGWFQCRLATDPDPYDEPRGVSGYVHALPGEPDLDRIIRMQPTGVTQRSHCPQVGVAVVAVYGDSRFSQHPLIGASVQLLDDPKFEGRNHALAKDGFEAVVPCHLEIKKERFTLSRRFDDSMRFPPEGRQDRDKFSQLQAGGIHVSPGAIGEATGIFDLQPVWGERSQRLKADLASATDEIQKVALQARLEAIADPSNARFFAARMLYSVAMGGTASVEDSRGWLPGPVVSGPESPWPLEFWFGAWDPDSLCGYAIGYLGVPLGPEGPAAVASTRVAEMMEDPAQRRR